MFNFKYGILKILVKRNLDLALYLYAFLNAYFGESKEIKLAVQNIQNTFPKVK